MRIRQKTGATAVLGLLAAAGDGSAYAQGASEEVVYRLSATVLACFVVNKDIYKAAAGEPVFLIADRCPPERPHTLLDTLTNEGPDVRSADPDKLDRLVTLNRSQLACLDRISVEASNTVVNFFPDACRVEPFTGRP